MQRKIFRIEETGAMQFAPTTHEVAEPRAARELRMSDGNTELKSDLRAMRETIARYRSDLASLFNADKEYCVKRAAGELDAAVESMEKAANHILQSAEGIDDSAKTLTAALKTNYERGLAQEIQDNVVRIYEACNFQDLAGQRIGKVITMLSKLEVELSDLLSRHGDGGTASAIPASNDRHLINGPKLDGDTGHASQRDIDRMFG